MWQKLAVSMMYEENMDKPSRNSQVVGGVGQHLKNQVDGHMHPTTPAAFMTDDGQNPIPSYISPMPMITNDHQRSPFLKQPTNPSTKHSAPDRISHWRWTWGTCTPARPQRPRNHKHLSWLLDAAGCWQWWQLADAMARMNQDEVVTASQRYLFLGNRLNAPWWMMQIWPMHGRCLQVRDPYWQDGCDWMLVIRSGGSWILPKHPKPQQNHELFMNYSVIESYRLLQDFVHQPHHEKYLRASIVEGIDR